VVVRISTAIIFGHLRANAAHRLDQNLKVIAAATMICDGDAESELLIQDGARNNRNTGFLQAQ